MMNLCPKTTSSSSSSAAEMIAENQDLMVEILLHLPVKSLLRFKCVSKQWKSMISNPYFAHRHTRRNSTRPTSSLLILKRRGMLILSLGNDANSPAGFRTPSFNFLNVTPDFTLKILGSCNGLMLCSLSSAFNDYSFAYCVCNLTTKRFTTFPRPGMVRNKPLLGVNLAFDPSESPHFKIVCVGQCCIFDDQRCQIEIYSSETRVFCYGAIHWLSPIGDSFYFVLQEESLKTLAMPPMQGDIYSTKRVRYLGQSGGILHLIDSEANMYYNPPMDIYEIGRDYSGWVLKCRINLEDIGCLYPDMVGHVEVHTQLLESGFGVHLSKYYLYSILSLVRGGDGETLEIILSIPNKIISYNPKENSAKVLLCLVNNMNSLDYRWFDVYQFNDSLSWL
ncbi:hypothetical protein M9H77_06442 [Catharanthus roseus]|uniref:Uncharacterized protein n=1 Tax=Catharanthus roseus TaxID=4058 RepID=A0ACC0BSD5_CATRO|nr:hypothetical protein M9H77_06442 [Catharanthus roseus]